MSEGPARTERSAGRDRAVGGVVGGGAASGGVVGVGTVSGSALGQSSGDEKDLASIQNSIRQYLEEQGLGDVLEGSDGDDHEEEERLRGESAGRGEPSMTEGWLAELPPPPRHAVVLPSVQTLISDASLLRVRPNLNGEQNGVGRLLSYAQKTSNKTGSQ